MAEDVPTPVALSPSISNPSRSSTATTAIDIQRTVPFARDVQLCNELDYVPGNAEKPRQLINHGPHQTLPDAPRVSLHLTDIVSYSLSDVDTPGLNTLGPKLWNVNPNPDILCLTEQLTKGRRIQITEDPSMHCVWQDELLFLKPIPLYLTSYTYWEGILDVQNVELKEEEREKLVKTNLGFLRTYARLVQRRSDFLIASKNLLLASLDGTTFEAFINFIKAFDNLEDRHVSQRYTFGLLELAPLNFWSAIVLHRYHKNRFESRYAAYFSRFFPVVLFIFALFSVILSAMQVILAVKQVEGAEVEGDAQLKRTLSIFDWAGGEAIGWTIFFGAVFVIWWVGISSVEAWKRRGVRERAKKKMKGEKDSGGEA